MTPRAVVAGGGLEQITDARLDAPSTPTSSPRAQIVADIKRALVTLVDDRGIVPGPPRRPPPRTPRARPARPTC